MQAAVITNPPVAVLSTEETRPYTAVSFKAASIDPKFCPPLLKLLAKELPLGPYYYLKRVAKRPVPVLDGDLPKAETRPAVLLCPLDHWNSGCINVTGLTEALTNASAILFDADVTAHEPYTLAQFHEWSRVWPTSYRNRPPTTPHFADLSPDVQRDFVNFMGMAVAEAERSKVSGRESIGAVIVDPSCNDGRPRVLATVSDGRYAHPLEHCTMRAAAAVGRAELERQRSIAHNSEEGQGPSKRTRTLGDDHAVSTPSHAAAAPMVSSSPPQSPATEPYLCTGYDLYITHEPCVMCAMALVHSRIRRVYFGLENRETGGLGGCCSIHTDKRLNHHYQAYRSTGDVEEACRRLLSL